MEESLKLFGQICNSRWFKDTAVILFLNKTDLFEEKIKTIPITQCDLFKSFSGNTKDLIATSNYIKKQFLKRNTEKVADGGDKSGQQVYVHMTCSLDQNNIETVFRDVQHIIINVALRDAALMYVHHLILGPWTYCLFVSRS